jgi:ferrous iron transport protein B
MKTVVLVGNPNVGKSVLFYQLTGNYVTVSNYPGTTVEISRGKANLFGRVVEVYDTPGLYSFSPVTGEEAVTRRLLFNVSPDLVVHVADAKNLPRMLPLTLELLSCGFPVLLVLNMVDEAEVLGVRVNHAELSRRLMIPVLQAAFTKLRGVNALKKEIARLIGQERSIPSQFQLKGCPADVGACLQGEYPLPRAMIGRLFLEGDQEIIRMVEEKEPPTVLKDCRRLMHPVKERRLLFEFALQRRQIAEDLMQGIFHTGKYVGRPNLLDRLTLDPVGGLILMGLVLYVGLYLAVGRFGAGTLVDLLEGTLFGRIIIPVISHWIELYLPWPIVRDLLAGEYGIITLGLRYAFAIILPIVGTFFFVFSILEDSGYLPRLAYLADSWMKKVGLNGRAVIPLTLGLGCGTMAVLVTRTLESKREQFIATFLLALAVPCSAQLGLILAILSVDPAYLVVWILVTGAFFVCTGRILTSVLPGERAPFFMELPPLRMPKFNAIFQKTLARMRWYFLEIIPVFILVSMILFLLRTAALLDSIAAGLAPMLSWMGLPAELSVIFLYGFFRRDYGAAGLYDLYRAGLVDSRQLLVAAVVLTLFLPCLAQMTMMIRERGPLTALLITCCVFTLAFLAGIMLHALLGIILL